ncbi:shikimate kinase [Quadrisphaera sp. DSM 44207]|uniref:shikimate kinase n=1 Tax=Quadrisphaera sp. DSM 44207 TaxID=1881057 RepID=UPI000884C0DE|nr:shikimate kinase [Quadrisphaera sp. DSM 44207]SDQ46552.1 shikimate kinase [Quadrisphaera sp. DSM 44207]
MPPRVVLVGPAGSGKSTVGALLAERLRVALRDTDTDVEEQAGASVPEVFAHEGEAGFRIRERIAVHAALAGSDGVLSLGGGAVLDPATRAELVGLAGRAPVVLLAVTWEAAEPRLGAGAGRPLLAGDARGRWSALLEQRRPLYEEVASVVVPTDGLTPERVAERVLAATGLAPAR